MLVCVCVHVHVHLGGTETERGRQNESFHCWATPQTSQRLGLHQIEIKSQELNLVLPHRGQELSYLSHRLLSS